MTTMYHASPMSKRYQIQRAGLRPATTDKLIGKEPVPGEWIYLFPTFSAASQWLSLMGGSTVGDIWRVTPTGPMQPDPNESHGYMTATPIPPENCTLVWRADGETYVPLREPGEDSPRTGASSRFADYLAVALEAPEPYLSFEKLASMYHDAAWADVAAKAKRLVQEGKVTILRNAPHHIMAHVIGDGSDNGGTPDEHDVEISRHDPNSQIIEQWNCFLPDAPVTMADGSRRSISELRPGDLVLTHKGNVRPVLNVWAKPYEGELARIRLSGFSEEIVATANHPFWAANEDYHHVRRNGWEGKYKSAHHQNRRGAGKVDYALTTTAKGGFKGIPLEPEVDWVEAGDLEEKMYLSMAAPVEEAALEVEGIRVEGDIAYLLGWYIAEGFVIKSDKNRIGFSLSPNEWHIAEELSQICEKHFGAPGTIRSDASTTDFRISSPLLRRMIEKLVGTGSATKSLHPSLLRLTVEDQKRLLDGWWRGDGAKDGNRNVLSTVSPTLANQARLLLARQGLDSAVTWNDNNFGNGFVKNARRIYQIRWQPERKRLDAQRFFQDGQVWMQITSVETEHYAGEVWDIEVASDHSFQAFGVNVHNCSCAWAQYAFDRTRKWKKFESRPCSHVLATYWKARSTPLDLSDMDENFVVPRGQKSGPQPGQMTLPGTTPAPSVPEHLRRQYGPDEPGLPNPEQLDQQPTPPSPQELQHTRDLAIPKQPESPFSTPPKAQPPQREQLQLFDITAPPGMQPMPAAQPVSVPGGRPPTPQNPVQFPGTFSHFIPVLTVHSSSFVVTSDALTDYFEEQREAHRPIYVALVNTVALERSGGKIPIPGAQPYGTSSEGIPLYRVMDLGWNPATNRRENADVNVLQGAPEQTGTYSDVPPGRRAEVLDFDSSLRMAYIVVPLNYPEGGDVRLHPMSLRGWVDYADIRPVQNAQTPWRSRR